MSGTLKNPTLNPTFRSLKPDKSGGPYTLHSQSSQYSALSRGFLRSRKCTKASATSAAPASIQEAAGRRELTGVAIARPSSQRRNESSDEAWTPVGLHDLFRIVEAHTHHAYVFECVRDVLVDLVGFEPTTSSMPFKKYQSLTDSSTRNRRLSKRRRGRRRTPRDDFWASGLHAD